MRNEKSLHNFLSNLDGKLGSPMHTWMDMIKKSKFVDLIRLTQDGHHWPAFMSTKMDFRVT
jgi:hypothetical protein